MVFKVACVCLFLIFGISAKPLQLSLNSMNDDPIQILFALGSTHQTRLMSFADDSFAMAHNDHVAFLYNQKNEQISSDYIIQVQNDVVLNKMSNDLIFQDVVQWKLWEFEDFQSPLSGWSKDTVSACGNNGNLFLGGHCNFANDFVYKIFEGLPRHSQIMVKFNFHFIDQWEGEEAFVQLDKVLIWKESYAWCDKVMPWYCKKYGINACGNDYPDRLSHPVTYVGRHDRDSFTLTFASTLNKNPCLASWGIDDLQIYIA